MLNEKYPFELKALPYSYDALEPYIDSETMHIHHDKHLKSYVNNLNSIIKENSKYSNWNLEKLIINNSLLPKEISTKVRNNAGGVYNHNFYFNIMKPTKCENNINEFKSVILSNFGSLEDFFYHFKESGLNRFASGWAWLATDNKNKLYIVSTPYHDTPLTMGLYPILLVDVWEHAYYLKYKNERNSYLDNWVNTIDWKKVKENYENASKFFCK